MIVSKTSEIFQFITNIRLTSVVIFIEVSLKPFITDPGETLFINQIVNDSLDVIRYNFDLTHIVDRSFYNRSMLLF